MNIDDYSCLVICACVLVLFSATEVYSFKVLALSNPLVVHLFSLSVHLVSNVTFHFSLTARTSDSVQQ